MSSLIALLVRFADPPAETAESRQLGNQLVRRETELVNLLANHVEAEDRLLAACAIARLWQRTDPVLPVLIEGLQSDDEAHRVYAAIACRALGPLASPAVPALIDVLALDGDGNVFGRDKAIHALAAIGSAASAATPALIGLLREIGPDSNANQIVDAINCAAALAAIGPAARKAIPVLRHCVGLDGSDYDLIRWLQLTAANAIWRIEGDFKPALAVATEMLTDDEGWLHEHAVEVLGNLGPAARPAVPQLQRLRDDEDEVVRQRVREALARIMVE